MTTPTLPQVRRVERCYTLNEEQTKNKKQLKYKMVRGGQEERGRDRESALVSDDLVFRV